MSDDKLAELKEQVDIMRASAFYESKFGSQEHQFQMQAMVSAYDVCLNLIKETTDEIRSIKKKVA
ncbi:hypothetical protein LCGC14_0384690 [marine sediment metagenome]|uniref:Uncharacterized protein n=1 Tax=marine sediment metagenome TaxID=412755 RepID=A0A0F9TJ87_9ZZZZ